MKLALITIIFGLVLFTYGCVSHFDCFTAAAEARVSQIESRYAADLAAIESLEEPEYSAASRLVEAKYARFFDAYRELRVCIEEVDELCTLAAFQRLQTEAVVIDPTLILAEVL